MSSPSSICMIVTPVREYPRATAHCAGAAPRSSGKREACTLRQPCRGAASASAGRMRPYAATTATSAAWRCNTAASRPCFTFSGCSTAIPRSIAHRFEGGGCGLPDLPTGRSGCATTATTCPTRAHVSRMGNANSGVPRKTMRIALRVPPVSRPAAANRVLARCCRTMRPCGFACSPSSCSSAPASRPIRRTRTGG